MHTKKILLSLYLFLNVSCGLLVDKKDSQNGDVAHPDLTVPKLQPKHQLSVWQLNPSVHSFQLGQGFKSLKGEDSLNEMTGSCIEHDEASSVQNSKGSTLSFSVSHVKSTSELYSLLKRDIALNVGYKMGGMDAVFSGSRNSLNEKTLSSSYSYALITGQKIFTPISFKKFNIRRDILDDYSAHPEDFYKKCGDSFVSSVSMGVAVTAVLECKTKNSQEKERIDQLISASANGNIVDAKGSIQKLLESTTKGTEAGCTVFVEFMGASQMKFDISPDNFAQSAVDFLTMTPLEDSVPIYFLTGKYDNIGSPAFKEQILDKIDLKFEQQMRKIVLLRDMISIYNELLASNRFLLTSYKDKEKKEKISKEIEDYIKKIDEWRREIDLWSESPESFFKSDEEEWPDVRFEQVPYEW